MRRAFLTLAVMTVLIVLAGLAYAPRIVGPEACDKGVRTVANGVDLGCIEHGRRLSVWTPPNGPAPMKDIKIPDDKWMDGP